MIDKEAFKGHTPGKWKVSSNHLTSGGFPTEHPHYEITADTRMFWIAHVMCFSDAHKGTEYEANARLIAAAPDLLADNSALEESVRELCETLGGVTSAYRELIGSRGCKAMEGVIAEAESALAKAQARLEGK